MENTGYIINPKVIQVFTSGPNSGSEVNPSYNIEFNPTSSFTSSIKCNNEFRYITYNPEICEPSTSSYCPYPNLISVSVISCSNYAYNYEIIYNPYGIEDTSLEYSLSPDFSSNVGYELLLNTPGINIQSIYIDNLTSLPLNGNTPVYFRIKNLCSGSVSSSLYSNIIQSSCIIESEEDYSVLLHKSSFSKCIVYLSDSQNPICNWDNDFCGNLYYINSSSLSSATILKLNDGITYAPQGWYSDGNVSRRWNGYNFITTNNCI